MKIFLFSVSIAILTSNSPKERLYSFALENTLSVERIDEAIILTREQLNPIDDLLPIVINENRENIPCQLDDSDGDGQWDEFVFVYSFQPSEKVSLNVLWIEKDNYPKFLYRTNIRFGKLNSHNFIEELVTDSHTKKEIPRRKNYYKPSPYQMDGPTWENDKMGFRQYFDGRNSRNVFGKRVSDMVLDTVGILPNGLPGDT